MTVSKIWVLAEATDGKEGGVHDDDAEQRQPTQLVGEHLALHRGFPSTSGPHS